MILTTGPFSPFSPRGPLFPGAPWKSQKVSYIAYATLQESAHTQPSIINPTDALDLPMTICDNTVMKRLNSKL